MKFAVSANHIYHGVCFATKWQNIYSFEVLTFPHFSFRGKKAKPRFWRKKWYNFSNELSYS